MSNRIEEHEFCRRAVKLFIPIEEFGPLIFNELIHAARMEHPNIVRCHRVGHVVIRERRFFFLLMELAEESLHSRIERIGALDEKEAMRVVRDITSGLAFLHRRGHGAQALVHRDIKPANILSFRQVDGSEIWKLSDFGTLRYLEKSKVHTRVLGTVRFMPPEAFRAGGLNSDLSIKWDMWALGIAICELLGTRPFPGKTEEEMQAAILMAPPVLPPNISPQMQSIVKGCLEKNPERRWSVEDIRRKLGESSITDRGIGAVADQPKPNRSLLHVGIAAVILVAFVVIAILVSITPPPR